MQTCILVVLVAALIVIAPSCYSQPDQAMLTVERWGMVELSVNNQKSYTNPFKDVVFECRMVSPSSRNLKVYGFYDGGNTWKLRLMPDEIGTWSYNASFSDGNPGVQGSIKCVKGKLHGPLKVSSKNPLWFERADGTPVYISAFHLWHIDELDEDTLAKTLDFIKSQGFNAVVGPHLTPEKRFSWERDAEGKPSFSHLNLGLWQGLDRALQALAKRDMVLIPFNIFGGTNRVPKIPGRADEDLFIRYWVARWGGFWNATYQPAAEWEEGFSEAEVARLCRRLHEEDNFRHIISIHSQTASSENVQGAQWLDYHTVQDKLMAYDPLRYITLVDIYRRSKKPILAHECLWEGNLYQKEAGLDVDNMRKGAWVIALSGGQINYADEVIFPRKYQIRGVNEVFYSAVGSVMKPCGQLYGSLKTLSDFMRSLPYWRMPPCPELSSNKVCLAEPGKEYVAYSLNGEELTLDLSQAKGKLKVYWFNPQTGERSRETVVAGGKIHPFTPPDTHDWVLHARNGQSALKVRVTSSADDNIAVAQASNVREENFDKEPGWEGINNRIARKLPPQTIRQNFGYSPDTRLAGGQPGEIGGTIQSAVEPAYYAKPIPIKTLNNRLKASGKLLVSRGGSNILFGFFNNNTLNEWRTPNTIAVRINGRGDVYHAHVESTTSRWRAAAGIIGNYDSVADRNHPLELPCGVVHEWSLDYDPAANDGNGLVTFTLAGSNAVIKLTPGLRSDGATFNHFGLLNVIKSYDDAGELWLDDLSINGEPQDFSHDPHWKGLRNRLTYATTGVRPRFDFGHSPTRYAGGKGKGELGGIIYRGDCRYTERMACYGDRLAALTLEQPISASGKVTLRRGVSDSSTIFGFYHSAHSMAVSDSQQFSIPRDFLGITIDGPSSEGFYFLPFCRNHSGDPIRDSSENPCRILPDGSTHFWSIAYDPAAAQGCGQITVTLDDQTSSLILPAGAKASGTVFDRFGIITSWIDGNGQEVYFDDLKYTFR